MKTFLLISLVALFLPAAYSQRVYSNNPPKGKTYVYKEVGGVARELEVYFPKVRSKKPVPGIILFHGGGWGGGSREMFSYQCDYFASRGLVAATVTYRLASKEEKRMMKGETSYKRLGIPDAKSAIRWFKQHADELGVDPERIIAGGGSAGGHISLLATTNPGLNDPSDPKGYDASVAAYVLFNPALSADDAKDPEVDLLHHLKADFPPAIVFFGSEDKWMENGWSPAREKMKSLGIKTVDMRILEGQGHGFFNSQPWADITLTAVDRFLNRLGLIEGEPTLPALEKGKEKVDWLVAALLREESKDIRIGGNPQLVESPYGKAVAFSGTSDALFLKNMPLDGLEEFTVEMIFFPDFDSPFEQRVLHLGEVSEDRMLLEIRAVDDKWYFDGFVSSDTNGKALIDEKLTHPLGQWHHVALVVGRDRLTTFVNGKKELSEPFKFVPIESGRSSIGVRQNEISWFKGMVYKIRITPKKLKLDEFMAH